MQERCKRIYITVSEDSHKGELPRLYILKETDGSVNTKGSQVAFPEYGIIYISVILQENECSIVRPYNSSGNIVLAELEYGS